jgi:hypothetical protein
MPIDHSTRKRKGEEIPTIREAVIVGVLTASVFSVAAKQTFTYVGMSGVMQGDNSLGYYTFDLKAKWAVFDASGAGTAGWISTQIEAKTGLGSAGDTQDAQSNLGTLPDPNGIWSSVNGVRLPELAWQESLRDGEVVLLAGMLSQRNYLDGNAPAGSAPWTDFSWQ